MTENEKLLEEIQGHVRKFEATRDPDLLTSAYLALDNVSLAHEPDPKIRGRLRSDALSLWLRLLAVLDRFRDPNFDPNDVPEKLVTPPAVPGGVVLRPGTDPAKIKDPAARAAYEKAIAANRAKAERYRLQTHLNRLNERIPPRAEAFIRKSYTSAPRDQQELQTAIDGVIKNPQRKASLLELRPSER